MGLIPDAVRRGGPQAASEEHLPAAAELRCGREAAAVDHRARDKIAIEVDCAARIVNAAEWRAHILERLRRQVASTGDATLRSLLEELKRAIDAREALAKRFRDSDDPFKVVIVRDMWLTGFDVPTLSTLYLDKPLKAHTLMQAIARANRVAEGKNNGLIVDYVGVFRNLQKAGSYTGEPCTVDGNVVTANGPEAAEAFARAVADRVKALIHA